MPGVSRPLLAVLVRGTGFLAFWLVLIGVSAGNLVVGLVTAAAAAWTSLHLFPAGALRLHPVAVPALVLRFLWQSVVAGWDVARPVMDPRLPLRPRFVV